MASTFDRFKAACSAADQAIANGAMPVAVSDELAAAAAEIDPAIGDPVLAALTRWQSSGDHWARVMPKPVAVALEAIAATDKKPVQAAVLS